MIKEGWPSLFENILPSDFILNKTIGVVPSIPRQIQRTKTAGHVEEIFPYGLISEH